MTAIIQIAAVIILLGVGWRVIRPQNLDADSLRTALTGLVYNLLLPALVLDVLWRANLGVETLWVMLLAALGVLLGLLLAYLWFRLFKTDRRVVGALLLAAAFPNATYLGLPVLESVLGEDGRALAIQYDLLACTPLLLTLGVTLAACYGQHQGNLGLIQQLLRVPPLWAAIFGVGLNLLQVPTWDLLNGVMGMLGTGVVPLMLFALGLSLRWRPGWGEQFRQVLPVLLIQLLITPLVLYGAVSMIEVSATTRTAIILEAAMPSMVLGVVLTDRFGLDSHIYAMAVTLTTALSMLSLPVWLNLI